jgi:hypothetical protein
MDYDFGQVYQGRLVRLGREEDERTVLVLFADPHAFMGIDVVRAEKEALQLTLYPLKGPQCFDILSVSSSDDARGVLLALADRLQEGYRLAQSLAPVLPESETTWRQRYGWLALMVESLLAEDGTAPGATPVVVTVPAQTPLVHLRRADYPTLQVMFSGGRIRVRAESGEE